MTKRKTTEQFIIDARTVHGDKFDYSKVEYKGNKIPITIICPKHGEFQQIPNNHLHGQGCPICKYEKFSLEQRSTTEEFIKKAQAIHGIKYDYSKVEYVNNRTPVTIICPLHGEFQQTPKSHLKGCECNKCVGRNKPYATEEFVELAKQIHHGKYSYTKTEYISAHQPIIITCPLHGDFSQQPCDHLQGHGCPKCNQSTLEKEIKELLSSHDIEYVQQQKFPWLKYKIKQSLDFYLPRYHVAIECQGRQHFKPLEIFGGQEEFEKIQQRDRTKFQLCQEHNISILYFCNLKDLPSAYLSDIYTNKEDLLEEIYRYGTKQRDTGIIQDCKDTVGSTNTLGTTN